MSVRTVATPNRCIPHRELVKKVCQKLSRSYPESRLGNKKNPLNEYLYITLSLRTHEKGLKAAYGAFKKRFPLWEMAHKASKKEIREAIVRGGLAKQKAANIKMALKQIHDRFGEVSLRGLRRLDRNEAEAFLLTLPGIGLKSARCIMMYSLGYCVLPVDTHVARILYRLGWLKKTDSKKIHDHVEQLVEPKLRFSFHVCCVQHGRLVCRGQYPKCKACCLTRLCKKVGIASNLV